MNLAKQFIKKQIIGVGREWESHIENIFRIFDRNLRSYAPDNILDVGCGDGSRTMRLAEYFNINRKNVYGLEYDQNHINNCNLRFYCSRIDLEIDSIPFKEKMFDLVICNQVLEHIKNYQNVINQLIRVTKNEGYIVIGVPNLAHFINRIYLLFGRQPMCIDIDSPHVRAFTHKSLSLKLSTTETVELIDRKGSLMYPFPSFLGKFLSRYFIGSSGYVCYLLKRV